MTDLELKKAFKQAQLDLLLIEIEERKFRLAEEKKRACTKTLSEIIGEPKPYTPKVQPWQNPYQIPAQFTSDSRVFLGEDLPVINLDGKSKYYEV